MKSANWCLVSRCLTEFSIRERISGLESSKNDLREDHHEILCIKIPFLKDAEDVSVERMGTDIVVAVDRAQRIITLPRALYSLEMEEFVREDNLLRVIFREIPVPKEEAELNVNKNVLDKLRSMRRMKI